MRYLVDGCYGDGNVGDEALLTAVLNIIRKKDSTSAISVLSADAQRTAREHGVRSIQQSNPWGRSIYGAVCKGAIYPIIRAIYDCDVFVLGGGELFRDDVGLRATFGMFHRLWLARMAGKRVLAVGVGAQHPTSKIGRMMLRHSLQSSHAVIFRDESSLETARSIHAARHLSWAPDLVFSLDPETELHEVDTSVVRIGVAIKSLPQRKMSLDKQNEIIQTVLNALHTISTTAKVQVTVFAFADADKPLTYQLAAGAKAAGIPASVEDSLEVSSIFRSLSQMTCLIAMPLHATIMAYRVCVPTISIVYDQKVEKLLSQFNMAGYGIDPDSLSVDLLVQKIAQITSDLPRVRCQLEEQVSKAGLAVTTAVNHVLTKLGVQTTSSLDTGQRS